MTAKKEKESFFFVSCVIAFLHSPDYFFLPFAINARQKMELNLPKVSERLICSAEKQGHDCIPGLSCHDCMYSMSEIDLKYMQIPFFLRGNSVLLRNPLI